MKKKKIRNLKDKIYESCNKVKCTFSGMKFKTKCVMKQNAESLKHMPEQGLVEKILSNLNRSYFSELNTQSHKTEHNS